MKTQEELYQRLVKIRENQNLTLRPTPHLKQTFTGFDGQEYPLVLRYYQVQGILHLIAMKQFLLGDDTGLGKTIQSIAALCYLWEKNSDLKAIILTNKSAVGQWSREFDKFTVGVKTILCKGTPKNRAKAYDEFIASKGPTVLIMGYRSAVRDISTIHSLSDYVLIADEATAFKNSKTQVHQTIAHMAKKASRVWALTATLIKNNLMEGWAIYKILVPDLFPSKTQFMNHYCIVRLQSIKGGRRQIPIIVGYRKKDIETFRKKIDPFFLGRPKFKVASELPPLTTSVIEVGMSRAQNIKYSDALSGLLEVVVEGESEEKEVTKLTAVTYCQQIVNHLSLIGHEGDSSKLDELMTFLTEGDFAGDKVIVFSRFRKMVDIIMDQLKKKKIKSCRITGSEDEDQRDESQKLFQNPDSGVNVICITTAAAEAVNLQAAKALVFFDTPWSAGDYIQLLGRMIRIGSVHDRCHAIHLVAKGTIDSRVMEVLNRKMSLVEQVIGKRIKGDDKDDEVQIDSRNEISDLFEALKQDARKAN